MSASPAEFEGVGAQYEAVLYDETQIAEHVHWMAASIVEHYTDRPKPLFVGLMKGAVPFVNDLMREVARIDPAFHPEVEYMMVETYGNDRKAKESKIVMGIDESKTDIAGRHVVLLDELLDEGRTAMCASDYLVGLGAGQVDMAVLGVKNTPRIPEFEDFPGSLIWCFVFPDKWITGMGMDDERLAPEGNRWLGVIATAKPLD